MKAIDSTLGLVAVYAGTVLLAPILACAAAVSVLAEDAGLGDDSGAQE